MIEKLQSWYQVWLGGNGWFFDSSIVLLIAIVLHAVLSFIFSRLRAKAAHTRTAWDEIVIESAAHPLLVLLWIVALSIILNIFSAKFPDVQAFQAIPAVREVLVTIVFIWFVMRMVNKGEDYFIEKAKRQNRDRTSVHAVAQLVKVVVVVLAALVILQTLGMDLSAVIAFGGFGGIAVGFAAKDTLANYFGGLMVYMDKPFRVGDWVYSPDRNIEGTVEYIGWRLCRIRTFDKRPLYVPNALFSSIVVVNATRMSHRRIKHNIGVRYQDVNKLPAIVNDIKAMLKSHPDIAADQTMLVNLIEFADSSVNIMVYTFTKTKVWAEFQEVQQDVLLKVIDIIQKHGAECAFPTQTLDIPEPIQHMPKGA